MVSGLRLVVAAAFFAAFAIADMHAFAGAGTGTGSEGVTPVQFVAYRERGGDTAKLYRWYPDRWKEGRSDFCVDSGSDCTFSLEFNNPNISDPTSGFVRRVPGGFLVTVPMVAFSASLTDGTSLGISMPWPGRVVGRNERKVRLVTASGAEELANIVVDFTGCIVDQDLYVTKFVAVR